MQIFMPGKATTVISVLTHSF